MNWNQALFRSLHRRKEGRAASSRKLREATETDAAGVVFLSRSIGKPPRPRDQRRLREIFLDRSATPPYLRLRAVALALRRGDARRGVALPPICSRLL